MLKIKINNKLINNNMVCNIFKKKNNHQLIKY